MTVCRFVCLLQCIIYKIFLIRLGTRASYYCMLYICKSERAIQTIGGFLLFLKIMQRSLLHRTFSIYLINMHLKVHYNPTTVTYIAALSSSFFIQRKLHAPLTKPIKYHLVKLQFYTLCFLHNLWQKVCGQKLAHLICFNCERLKMSSGDNFNAYTLRRGFFLLSAIIIIYFFSNIYLFRILAWLDLKFMFY